MKKILYILMILLTVAGSFLPLNSVMAEQQMDALVEEIRNNEIAPITSLWHCVTAPGDDCDIEDATPLIVEGAYGATALIRAKMICTVENCDNRVPIYIGVEFTAAWSSPFSRDVSGYVEIQARGNTVQTAEVDCGSGTSGGCSGTFYFEADIVILSPNEDWHGSAQLGLAGLGTGDTNLIHYIVTFSNSPKQCDSSYNVDECVAEGNTIDPTQETVTEYTLEQGETYRLNLEGEWQSTPGGGDTADLEYSFDGGVTWQTQTQLMENNLITCVEQDPASMDQVIYFTAPSDGVKIRVKDTPGQYGNNTGSMTMDLCHATPNTQDNILDCSGQFTVGTSIVSSGTIQANVPYRMTFNSAGNSVWLEYGKWYVLTTSGGPWHDGGSGPDRYDIQMSDDILTNNPTWHTVDDYSLSNCYSTGGNYVSVYFQGSHYGALALRVNDQGEVFSGNTGSVNFTITVVDDFNPIPQGCAMTFEVNNFIEERWVNSKNGAGIQLLATTDFQWPVWPFGGTGGEQELPRIARYFVLDVEGSWFNDSVRMISAEMNSDGGAWSDLYTWEDAICVQVYDPLGHVRVFFDASKQRTWMYRVQDLDNSIWNNDGQLGYKLYYATNFEIPPGEEEVPDEGFCDTYYTHEVSGTTITLYGANSSGVALPVVEPDAIVAIQVSEGPWKNSGVDSYKVAISDDDGLTYTELLSYNGVVCKAASPDTDHPIVYLYGRQGKSYRMRVYDPGGNYYDNSLNIKLIVYASEATDAVDPWDSCANNYTLSEVPLSDDVRTISAALMDGKAITSITPGTMYALEITNEGGWGGWGTGVTNFYSAFASNGDDWKFLPSAPWITCAVSLTKEDNDSMDRYRIYWNAEAAKTYRLKVASFLPAEGWIRYRLYRANSTDTNLPPDEYHWPGTVPETWGGCNVTCQRPAGLLTSATVNFGSLGSITLPLPNVGGWLEYGRCSIVVYFSWCDYHTAALEKIFTSANSKDPFGSFVEMGKGFTTLIAGIENLKGQGGQMAPLSPRSVIFGGDTGGQSGESWGGLLQLSKNNPLFGKEFDFTSSPTIAGPPGTGGQTVASYSASCEAYAGGYLGNAVSGFCWGMAMVHSQSWGMPLLMALQLGCDLMLIFGFVAYLMDKWVGRGVPA